MTQFASTRTSNKRFRPGFDDLRLARRSALARLRMGIAASCSALFGASAPRVMGSPHCCLAFVLQSLDARAATDFGALGADGLRSGGPTFLPRFAGFRHACSAVWHPRSAADGAAIGVRAFPLADAVGSRASAPRAGYTGSCFSKTPLDIDAAWIGRKRAQRTALTRRSISDKVKRRQRLRSFPRLDALGNRKAHLRVFRLECRRSAVDTMD
jgi:hypothetical protein